MNPLNPAPRAKRRLNSLLGLAFDGQTVRGAVVQRTAGGVEISKPFTSSLTIDLLGGDAELASRELLNLLEAGEIRERRCSVALPLKWVLAARSQIPELPDADAASMLQIEAESAFPCDVDTLQIAASKGTPKGGEQSVMLVAVPLSHVEKLGAVLKAAGLTPVSYSLGVAAMQPPGATGELTIAAGDDRVDLQVTAAGGIVALRALDGVTETEDSAPVLQSDRVAREARITLAQLPPALSDSVKQIFVYGAPAKAARLVDELRARFEPSGATIRWVRTCGEMSNPSALPAGSIPSPETCLAARILESGRSGLELLPPRISPLQRFVAKYSNSGLKTAGLAAAAAALLVGLLFSFQQWQLSHWRSEWSKIAAKSQDLEELSALRKKFRPWHDRSFACLSILKELTKTFPEDGSVTARTLEIRELDMVTCSGTARDNASLLSTMERLRADPRVSDLTYEQIRGKTPAQFTFNLRWIPGGRSEN
jgi:hypothetical protein